jgi:hypothetical protein
MATNFYRTNDDLLVRTPETGGIHIFRPGTPRWRDAGGWVDLWHEATPIDRGLALEEMLEDAPGATDGDLDAPVGEMVGGSGGAPVGR